MKELQPIQMLWEKSTLCHHQTLEDRVGKLREEVGEFFQDLPVDDAGKIRENPRYFAMEAIDIMILCSSIIDKLGFDVSALAYEKLHQNFTKYPKELITKFMDGGMTHQEALAEAKKNWDERKTASPKPRRRGW